MCIKRVRGGGFTHSDLLGLRVGPLVTAFLCENLLIGATIVLNEAESGDIHSAKLHCRVVSKLIHDLPKNYVTKPQVITRASLHIRPSR